MATIKRKKVSGKSVSGQKKGDLLHNKLFWIIVGTVLIIGATVGIILGVYFANKTDEEQTCPDYFSEVQTYKTPDDVEHEVKFTKMSYEGLLMHCKSNDQNEGTYQKHIFYFAYDLTQFWANEDVDAGKSHDEDSTDVFYYQEYYQDAFEAAIKLQYYVDEYNKTVASDEDKAYFYIVDTSVGNNSSIFTDSFFGISSDECKFAFGYVAGEDKAKDSYEVSKVGDKVTSNPLAVRGSELEAAMKDFKYSIVGYAIDFMKNFKFKLTID